MTDRYIDRYPYKDINICVHTCACVHILQIICAFLQYKQIAANNTQIKK